MESDMMRLLMSFSLVSLWGVGFSIVWIVQWSTRAKYEVGESAELQCNISSHQETLKGCRISWIILNQSNKERTKDILTVEKYQLGVKLNSSSTFSSMTLNKLSSNDTKPLFCTAFCFIDGMLQKIMESVCLMSLMILVQPFLVQSDDENILKISCTLQMGCADVRHICASPKDCGWKPNKRFKEINDARCVFMYDGRGGCWSLSQLSSGERQDTPWTVMFSIKRFQRFTLAEKKQEDLLQLHGDRCVTTHNKAEH
ncbi:hypothetical protein MHYP_G00201860 [Metynnis hypsauchen]